MPERTMALWYLLEQFVYANQGEIPKGASHRNETFRDDETSEVRVRSLPRSIFLLTFENFIDPLFFLLLPHFKFLGVGKRHRLSAEDRNHLFEYASSMGLPGDLDEVSLDRPSFFPLFHPISFPFPTNS